MKRLIALGVIALVAVLVFFTQKPEPLSARDDGADSRNARIATTPTAQTATVSTAVATTAPHRSMPTGPQGASWTDAVHSGQPRSTAVGLLSSSDPTDLMRGTVLYRLCISGYDLNDLSQDQAEAIQARMGRAYRLVVVKFTALCGGLANLSVQVAQARRAAADAQLPLALAPTLTNNVLNKGLSPAEFGLLTSAFGDRDSATLWLAQNFRHLDRAMGAAPNFSAWNSEDLRAASLIALCQRGLDCGPESLLSLQLCVNTDGRVCSIDGPQAALNELGAEHAARIVNAAFKIGAALDERDPEALGLKVRR